MIDPAETLLISTAVLVGSVLLVFWGTMAVHCFKNRELPPRERLVWLLVIAFGKLVGVGAYYLLRYRQPRDGVALRRV